MQHNVSERKKIRGATPAEGQLRDFRAQVVAASPSSARQRQRQRAGDLACAVPAPSPAQRQRRPQRFCAPASQQCTSSSVRAQSELSFQPHDSTAESVQLRAGSKGSLRGQTIPFVRFVLYVILYAVLSFTLFHTTCTVVLSVLTLSFYLGELDSLAGPPLPLAS